LVRYAAIDRVARLVERGQSRVDKFLVPDTGQKAGLGLDSRVSLEVAQNTRAQSRNPLPGQSRSRDPFRVPTLVLAHTRTLARAHVGTAALGRPAERRSAGFVPVPSSQVALILHHNRRTSRHLPQ